MSNKNTYSLWGVFGQVDFLSNKSAKIYGEFGYYYMGNYCTCGNGEPSRKKGLKYASLGGGAELKLTNHIFLDMAFIHKSAINVSKQQHLYRSYNIYIIGLNTRLNSTNIKK